MKLWSCFKIINISINAIPPRCLRVLVLGQPQPTQSYLCIGPCIFSPSYFFRYIMMLLFMLVMVLNNGNDSTALEHLDTDFKGALALAGQLHQSQVHLQDQRKRWSSSDASQSLSRWRCWGGWGRTYRIYWWPLTDTTWSHWFFLKWMPKLKNLISQFAK